MRAPRKNGSRMFLTELMFSILFFIIIIAICVELFAAAHSMSVRSRELTQSVNVASNIAEFYQAWDGDAASWELAFPEGKVEKNSFKTFYNEQWQECASEDAAYYATGYFSGSDTLTAVNIKIIAVKDNRIIYNMDVYRATKR